MPGIGACSALAAKVGRVLSYGHPGRGLVSQQLSQCNSVVAGVAMKSLSTAPGAQMAPKPMVLANPPVAMAAAPKRQDQQRKVNAFLDLQRARTQAITPKPPVSVSVPKPPPLLAGATAVPSIPTRPRYVVVTSGTDCNDARGDTHAGASEVCDGIDNNCDSVVDEGQTFRFFLDADGDGHGDPMRAIDACPYEQAVAASEGRWLVLVGNDCNDANADVWNRCE